MTMRHRSSSRRGSAIVEFGLVAFLLITMILAGFEFDRMVLAYTTMSNAAREGVRYAIVHGSSRTGVGADGPSGPSNNPAQVVADVKYYAGTGALNASLLAASCSTTATGICVTYPDGSNAPGSHVKVVIIYKYDPWFSSLPLRVNLNSTSEGIIVF